MAAVHVISGVSRTTNARASYFLKPLRSEFNRLDL